MPVVISFLRGINVGGHKKIRMAELRQLYASLGLRDVRSVLQSGNVVFRTDENDMRRVGRLIETGIADAFSFEVRAILRTAAAFRGMIARQPFNDEELSQGGKIAVVFLDEAASKEALADLREGNPGREIIHDLSNELYIFYADDMAGSKLNNKRIESTLKTTASARNWNTCQRLLKLLNEYES